MASAQQNSDMNGVDAVVLTYAQAMLGAADKAGEVDTVVAELDAFVNDVWNKLPGLAGVLGSTLIAGAVKGEMVRKALDGRAGTTFANFLAVVADHDRLGHLPAIARAVHHLVDERKGLQRVEVVTAAPLEQSQLTSLEQTLRGLLKGTPVIHNTIDPRIIGGLTLRVGDTVYDASLSAQLKRVREQMVFRSVHEIQSRRDRFSTAEGN
ncbi:MAG: ATP synthase F1 subunit delta [Pirellulales bacterium]